LGAINDQGGACVDQNGCKDQDCGAGTCVDVVAPGTGFTCDCPEGYEHSSETCVSLPVCETIAGACPLGTCVNDAEVDDGYYCDCNPGFYDAGDFCTHDCFSGTWDLLALAATAAFSKGEGTYTLTIGASVGSGFLNVTDDLFTLYNNDCDAADFYYDLDPSTCTFVLSEGPRMCPSWDAFKTFVIGFDFTCPAGECQCNCDGYAPNEWTHHVDVGIQVSLVLPADELEEIVELLVGEGVSFVLWESDDDQIWNGRFYFSSQAEADAFSANYQGVIFVQNGVTLDFSTSEAAIGGAGTTSNLNNGEGEFTVN
jgi:hypothetical protein